jgi:hypothetical protein
MKDYQCNIEAWKKQAFIPSIWALTPQSWNSGSHTVLFVIAHLTMAISSRMSPGQARYRAISPQHSCNWLVSYAIWDRHKWGEIKYAGTNEKDVPVGNVIWLYELALLSGETWKWTISDLARIFRRSCERGFGPRLNPQTPRTGTSQLGSIKAPLWKLHVMIHGSKPGR